MTRALLLLVIATLASPSWAVNIKPNKPCTGKKGGISHCDGSRFVCRDGSYSQSKKDCRTMVRSTKQGETKR